MFEQCFRHWLRCALRICGIASVLVLGSRGTARADEPLHVLSGPAHVVLEPGQSWLDLPAGYVYVTNPADVKRAVESDGGNYSADDLAVVGVADGNDVRIRSVAKPLDEAGDWADAPSPAWKDRQLAQAKAEFGRPPDGSASDFNVLGWYAEPTFSIGPPRRFVLPLLMQNGAGSPYVLTLGVAANSARQLAVLAVGTPEGQAGRTAHVEQLLGSVRFGPRPEDPLPLDKLPWAAGPGHLDLALFGVALDVPPGYVYLTRPDDIAKYEKSNTNNYSPDELAVVAPADLSWGITVSKSPGALGPDDSDPLAKSLNGWLDHFRQLFAKSVGDGADKVTYAVPCFRESPAYTPGPPRSLFLPVTIQGSKSAAGDGGTWTALYNYLASPAACVQVMACVPADRYDAVLPQFQAIAHAIRFAPGLEPPPAQRASVAQSLGPRDNLSNDYGFQRLMAIVFAGAMAVIAKMSRTVAAVARWIMSTLFGRSGAVGQPDAAANVDLLPSDAATDGEA